MDKSIDGELSGEIEAGCWAIRKSQFLQVKQIIADFSVAIGADTAPFVDALVLLEKLFNREVKLIERFLGMFNTFDELVQVDICNCSADGASEIRFVLKPSDRLAEFVVAAVARDAGSFVV